ncbi:hypothetical protein CerSpe_142710 [Prunus speciosa]
MPVVVSNLKILPQPLDLVIEEICSGDGNGGCLGIWKGFEGGGGFDGFGRKRNIKLLLGKWKSKPPDEHRRSNPALPSLPPKLSNQPVEIEPDASQQRTAASYIQRKERAKRGKQKTISQGQNRNFTVEGEKRAG